MCHVGIVAPRGKEPENFGVQARLEGAPSNIPGENTQRNKAGRPRSIPGPLLAQLAARRQRGETIPNLRAWLHDAHGIDVTRQCVSESLERLRAEQPRKAPRAPAAAPEPKAEAGAEPTASERLLSAAKRLQTVIDDPETAPDALAKCSNALATVLGRMAAIEKKRAAAGPVEDERGEAAAELKRRLESMRERMVPAETTAQTRTGTSG